MPTNLLLLPLLGGYWFLHTFHYTRFRSQRLDGYRLLVESALAGVVFAVLARGLVLLLRICPCVKHAWLLIAGDRAPFLGTAVVSLGLGIAAPYLLNSLLETTALLTRKQAQLKAIEKHGNHLLRLLHTASAQERTVSVTLSNRKVYIGLVVDAPNLESHDAYVSIIPFFSGHRDKDTLDLDLTVAYIDVYESGVLLPEDCKVTLPITGIAMVGFFDHTATDAFTVIRRPHDEEDTDPPAPAAA